MPQAIVDALLEPLGEAMRRRDFIRAIAYSTTAWPFTALAQQSGRSRLIGVLINNPENDPEMQASLVAFKQELERLNWLDGGNARFDIRFTEGDLDQMRRLTKEMVAMQPDVIFVHSSVFAAAAQRETSTIPIVFVYVSDPVGRGFVASLAHPGGNLTGLLLYEESIVGKWLGMLKEIAPQMKRVAFIANPKSPTYDYFLKTAQQVARSFAVELVPSPVDTATDIEGVIRSFADTPNGGLFFPPNIASSVHRDLIIGLAARYRLPAVYAFRFFPLEGGLMSYGTEQVDVFRQAAPAELPVQAPTNYKTVVNLKTAKALGLDVPPSLLVRADEVIEQAVECPLLAQSGHPSRATECPLLGVKRTSSRRTGYAEIPQPHDGISCDEFLIHRKNCVRRPVYPSSLRSGLPQRD